MQNRESRDLFLSFLLTFLLRITEKYAKCTMIPGHLKKALDHAVIQISMKNEPNYGPSDLLL